MAAAKQVGDSGEEPRVSCGPWALSSASCPAGIPAWFRSGHQTPQRAFTHSPPSLGCAHAPARLHLSVLLGVPAVGFSTVPGVSPSLSPEPGLAWSLPVSRAWTVSPQHT